METLLQLLGLAKGQRSVSPTLQSMSFGQKLCTAGVFGTIVAIVIRVLG